MKIYLSILNEGWIRSELAIKLPRWLSEMTEAGHEIHYESSFLRPIAHNRNTIVKRFLASDCDYLLQIDSDVVPSKNPIELVEYTKDIISCPCWIYQHKKFLNIYKYDKDGIYLIPVDPTQHKELIEIDSTGSGIIMCSRKVLEDIKAPFERLFDEDGIETRGLDLAFCDKAKEKGYKIYSHLDYISKHYKTIDLGEI